MKYILMMHCPKTGYDSFGSMPLSDIKAHIAHMHELNRYLKETGEFVSAEGLADPRQAKIIRSGKDTAPITDGVFPESKEFLAGFLLIDVDTPERAAVIAAKMSSAPGKGGIPMSIPIEVREVMSAPPKEFL